MTSMNSMFLWCLDVDGKDYYIQEFLLICCVSFVLMISCITRVIGIGYYHTRGYSYSVMERKGDLGNGTNWK